MPKLLLSEICLFLAGILQNLKGDGRNFLNQSFIIGENQLISCHLAHTQNLVLFKLSAFKDI